MKNIFVALIMILLGHTLVTAQNLVTIKGTVKGDLKGHTRIYVYGQGIKTDTAYIKNGSFELTLPFTKPFLPMLFDEYDVAVKKGINPYVIVIDRPGTVYLHDIDIEKGFDSGKVSGIKSAVDYDHYNERITQVTKEIKTQLLKKYGDSITKKTHSPDYEAYLKDFQAMNKTRENEVITDFVKANPDDFLSAYILARNKSSMSIGELEKAFQLLSKNNSKSEYGENVSDYINGVKKSEVGQVISDFTLNNASDQPFNFSQLKGKYVIIDFWASWCGPCKASFPHMKSLYEKYKGDRFEIYSISVDQSKSEWLKELKKQELPWLQALDTKKISTSAFAVTAVPTTFMIDPQGKILIKEVGIDPSGDGALEKKLIEIFGAR